MGWRLDGAPHHEGYLAGVAYCGDGRYREIDFALYGEAAKGQEPKVVALQVACDCGWRSMRFLAPAGTGYRPYAVVLPADEVEPVEAKARKLWREHVEQELARERRSRLPELDEWFLASAHVSALLPEIEKGSVNDAIHGAATLAAIAVLSDDHDIGVFGASLGSGDRALKVVIAVGLDTSAELVRESVCAALEAKGLMRPKGGA